MKYGENIREVTGLNPDFLGFIFYPKSPRYMVGTLQPEDIQDIPPHIKKVGVFVDESLQVVLERVAEYGLDVVQLHGSENPGFCKKIKEKGVGVIKVFHVGETMDWDVLKAYQSFTDYFLFDTKSENYGGTGKAFNWKILESYKLDTPYFLGGGVSLDNIDLIKTSGGAMPYALDVNSRFEEKPGYKDTVLLTTLTEKLALVFP